jgi:hypothetical protein
VQRGRKILVIGIISIVTTGFIIAVLILQPPISNTPAQGRKPFVFLYVFGKADSGTLSMLNKTEADVAYRALLTFGDSVDTVHTNWAGKSSFIEKCHAMGVQVVALISASIMQRDQFSLDFINSTATRNCNGDIILQYQSDVGTYYYHGCLNHEAWREHLFEVAKVGIDMGVDGIEFDEPAHWWWTGECYADECLNQFKQYLANKYSAQDLQTEFGISNITDFSFRDYLSQKNLTAVSEQDRLRGTDPLGRQYYLFELTSLAEHFGQLTSMVKNYTRQHYNRELTVVANQFEMKNDVVPFCPYVDSFSIGTVLRIWYTDKLGPPYHTASPYVLIARAINETKQPVVFVDDDYVHAHVTSDVAKTLIGETYAFGGFCFLPYHSTDAATLGPTETIAEYGQFVKQNEELLGAAQPLCNVGLFVSYTEMLWEYVPSMYDSIYGACQILTDAHIPFNVIFSGDGEVLQDHLTLADLMKYDVIYLPHSPTLSDRQVQLLRDYVAQGGKLLFTGACGLMDSNRNYRGYPFEDLVGLPNVKYIKWEDDVWGDWTPYRDYEATKNATMRMQVLEAIKSLVSLPLETNSSATVSVNPCYQPEHGRLLIKLVNRDYNSAEDRLIPQKNIDIRVKLPEGFNVTGAKAFCCSPDVALNNVELSVSVSNGFVEFTVPELDSFTVVSLQHDTVFKVPIGYYAGRNSDRARLAVVSPTFCGLSDWRTPLDFVALDSLYLSVTKADNYFLSAADSDTALAEPFWRLP